MNQTKQPLTKQEIQQVSDILTRQTARAMVIDRYGSTPEEAKKVGLRGKHLVRQTVPGCRS